MVEEFLYMSIVLTPKILYGVLGGNFGVASSVRLPCIQPSRTKVDRTANRASKKEKEGTTGTLALKVHPTTSFATLHGSWYQLRMWFEGHAARIPASHY